MQKNIVLIGPFGEVGGVSIHLRRLKILLEKEYKIYLINESKSIINEERSLNLRKIEIKRYLEIILKADYIHVHSGNIYIRLFHVLIGTFFNKKVIVTLHSFRQTLYAQDWLLKKLPRRIISVSEEIHEKINSSNSIILNAFIPPILNKEPDLEKDFCSMLNKKKEAGKSIIVGNAFRIIYQNGKDLYGIDQLIELSKLFKKKSYPGFILFIIGSLKNGEESFHKFCSLIEKEGLEDFILLYNKAISFSKLIEISDLVIRPTTSDGDALTIREAMYLNKPVIASDVVKRPKGTIIYKSGNIEDLYQKTLEVLKEEKMIDNANVIDIDFRNIYMKLYNI